MAEHATILVIDDDPIQRALIRAALEPEYVVIEGDGGGAICTLVAAAHPALVLLDIVMPGVDGYAACRALKDDFDLAETPVLFLSAQLGLTGRLAAYEAGGEDFIGKPFDPAELHTKIELTLARQRERRELKANAQSAFTTAMSAMSSAAELGIVIHALRQSFSAKSLTELADVALAATRDYGLDGCMRLHAGDALCLRGGEGEVNPVEASILRQLAAGDRIQRLGRQASYNYGGVTLLVRNMPVADDERCGRLRDNLALLTEGVAGRLSALEDQRTVEREQQRQARLAEHLAAALSDIDARHQRQRAEAELMLQKMLDGVEHSFLSLGLTEGQEDAVAEMLRGTVRSVVTLYDQGLAVDQHLARLRELMQA